MNDKQIKNMILAIIKEVDYDHYKFYVKSSSEDWEAASEQLNDMVAMVKKKFLKEAK